MYNLRPMQYAQSERAPVAEVLPYLRRVYALFTGGIAFAIAGALVALYAGTPVPVGGEGAAVAVPPIVAFGLEHYIIMMLVFFGAFFGASALRRVPGLNLLALFGYTFITGLFIAPSVFIAQLMASQGADARQLARCATRSFSRASPSPGSPVTSSPRERTFPSSARRCRSASGSSSALRSSACSSTRPRCRSRSRASRSSSSRATSSTTPRASCAPARTIPSAAALRLFLDVINLFLALLRILSAASRRN